jgi:hypothetical protein
MCLWEIILDVNCHYEGQFVPNQIQPRKQPGLYMIRCTQNDWRYYGESQMYQDD